MLAHASSEAQHGGGDGIPSGRDGTNLQDRLSPVSTPPYLAGRFEMNDDLIARKKVDFIHRAINIMHISGFQISHSFFAFKSINILF